MTLLKVMEQEISKSHLHLKISSQVRTTLDSCRKEMKGRKIELGRLINDDGEILIKRRGGKKEIDWDEALLEGYIKNNYKPYHTTHNHPNLSENPFPTSLSEQDLYGLFHYSTSSLYDGKLMMKSVTVEDSWNNSRMTVVLGDSWHKKPVNEWDEGMKTKLKKAEQLSHEVEDTWKNCLQIFHAKKWDYLKQNLDTNTFPSTDKELETYYKYRKTSFRKAMKESGYLPKIKELKKKFREIDCRFSLENMEDCEGKWETPNTYIDLLKVE